MMPLTRLIYESLTPTGYSFDVFFDIGANVGQTAARAIESFPESRVLSFEPVSSTYAQLEHAAQNLPRKVETYKFAFGERNETVDLFLKELGVHNTLLPEKNKPLDKVGGASEKVQVRRLTDFTKEKGIAFIDVLKMDVEGYEVGVLKGGSALLQENVAFVVAECNFTIDDHRNSYFPDLNNYLSVFGFTPVGIYDVVYRKRDGRLEYCDAVFVNKTAIARKKFLI